MDLENQQQTPELKSRELLNRLSNVRGGGLSGARGKAKNRFMMLIFGSVIILLGLLYYYLFSSRCHKEEEADSSCNILKKVVN